MKYIVHGFMNKKNSKDLAYVDAQFTKTNATFRPGSKGLDHVLVGSKFTDRPPYPSYFNRSRSKRCIHFENVTATTSLIFTIN